MQSSQQQQKWSWRGIWVLPVALSLGNLTYGAVTGVPANASVWASAGLQALATRLPDGRRGASLSIANSHSLKAART
jgi:hypothetical protein